MKNIHFNPLKTAVLLLLCLLGGSTWAQYELVQESIPFGDYAIDPSARQNATFSRLHAQAADGAFNPGTAMVRLNLDAMLTNEAMVIELDGKRFPVVKSRHLIDPEDPRSFSVFGYMKGDKSLPFYYHQNAEGIRNLTFQSPRLKYYFTQVDGDWFAVYSYNAAHEAEVACGEKDEKREVRSEEQEELSSGAGNKAGVSECKLRTVFLMTDQVEVSWLTMRNALDQNIAYINSNVLQNGNGRNPVISSYANTEGCTYQIERVALLRSNTNAYGSYNEVTCPIEGNGNVMRDQMRDGLSGTGDLAWLQTLRKDYAADLIVLLTSNELRSSGGACSSGPNLNGIAGGIGVGRNASVIVQRAVGTFLDGSFNADPTNLTLIHELGHNLGCAHEDQDPTFQGYCDAAAPQKTIMHTLNGTAPCDNGRNERRAVFSHDIHTFADGADAGSTNHQNAQEVGVNFDEQAEFFEDSNWGDNDLYYSGDFNNNSGSTRFINTPGYVVLSYARNSGSNFVRVQSADYVYVTGNFSTKKISLVAVPNNASKTGGFEFDETAQIESLEEGLASEAADRLFSVHLFPNPSESEVRLGWFLSGKSEVSISIYNAAGELVAEVLRGAEHAAGDHELLLPTAGLAKGLYMVQLKADGEEQTLRMVRF